MEKMLLKIVKGLFKMAKLISAKSPCKKIFGSKLKNSLSLLSYLSKSQYFSYICISLKLALGVPLFCQLICATVKVNNEFLFPIMKFCNFILQDFFVCELAFLRACRKLIGMLMGRPYKNLISVMNFNATLNTE